MDLLYTIDSGNSQSKMALFKDGILQDYKDFQQRDPNIPVIFSNVSEKDMSLSESAINALSLKSSKEFLGMPINYSETLGIDRICVAWYAFKNLIEEEVALCIDAGTYTTIDLVTKNGFIGGHIFPGVEQFFNSYEKGALLPTLKSEDIQVDCSLGHDTFSSINNSFFLSMSSVLNHLISTNSVNKVVLTGGFAPHFFNLLENFNNIIVEYKKDLIHYSLKNIYNNVRDLKQ
ncbi:MAG: type III pantothenate kinase [Bacteriovoracaceae bacterium]